MNFLKTTIPNFNIILLRIISFAVIITGSAYLNESVYNLFFFSVLFGHYILQYIYTENFTRYLLPDFSNTNAISILIARLLFLIAITYLFLTSKFLPIELTFGIHFVFSEVYFEKHNQKAVLAKTAHFFTACSLYSLYMYESFPFNSLPRNIYLYIFSVGIVAFLINDFVTRKKITATSFSLIIYELIGLMFITIYPLRTNKLINIIFYHLVWWFFYPFSKETTNFYKKKKTWSYLLATISITGIIGFLFTIHNNYLLEHVKSATYARLFGSLHIISSFFLSYLNPSLINSLFGKERGAEGILLKQNA